MQHIYFKNVFFTFLYNSLSLMLIYYGYKSIVAKVIMAVGIWLFVSSSVKYSSYEKMFQTQIIGPNLNCICILQHVSSLVQ